MQINIFYSSLSNIWTEKVLDFFLDKIIDDNFRNIFIFIIDNEDKEDTEYIPKFKNFHVHMLCIVYEYIKYMKKN